ncbi:BhlA/UviB family holin-like peptide [Chengkuizengella sp. SCS-71B]|uniref:BhlA/UviB family holin-like peptide n=1 Tax=Chengkuizengella sp. SCS-71B TaxID=3115290 RepID=UPI0032C221E8
MELNIIQYFLTQGPFAVLFVWLLIYVMRNSKEREDKLIESHKEREGQLISTLEKFSEKYDMIIDELRQLKEKMSGRK